MSTTFAKSLETGLPWHVVEEAINRESQWLERVIEQTSINEVPGCDVSVDILSGKSPS